MKTIEVKIPKEVRQHKETIFFGLSARQFICSGIAVGLAVGVYLLLDTVVGKETASWICILSAAPFAVAGFFSYHGMNLEQFVWALLKSEFIFAGPRPYASENFHYKALNRKGNEDFD